MYDVNIYYLTSDLGVPTNKRIMFLTKQFNVNAFGSKNLSNIVDHKENRILKSKYLKYLLRIYFASKFYCKYFTFCCNIARGIEYELSVRYYEKSLSSRSQIDINYISHQEL